MYKTKDSRSLLVIMVIAYVLAYLAYQHFNSGVPSHHLLHDSSLPAISSWWGVIILPVLSWVLGTLINKQYGKLYPKHVWFQLAGAGLYALVNGALFYAGYVEFVSMLALPSILVAAVFFRIYKPAYFLGYAVAASMGFGPIIPIIGGGVFAVIGYIVFNFIRPLPNYLRILLNKNK